MTLALGVALPAPASPHPAPAASAVADEAALASWTFPTSNPGKARWFFAGAFRDTAAGGRTRTFAFAVEGICRKTSGKGSRGTSCHGKGVGGTIPLDRFVVDPALRTARLVLKEGPGTSELTWSAGRRAIPYGYLASEACREGSGEGLGMLQPALAGGHLFGHELTGRDVDSAFLSRGAMVTECAPAVTPETLRRAASGRRISVVFR